jgi:hypothetical protein
MSAKGSALPASPEDRTDIAAAVTRLRGKHRTMCKEFDYYDGDQPVVYATDQLSAYFKNLTSRFMENWCAPVVDAVLERLTLNGFDCSEGSESAKDALEELMESGGLALEAYDAHAAAVIAGESAIIVTPHEDAPNEVEVYANDPRCVQVFYDPRHPKKMRMAAKEYEDELTGFWHLTLYYPDRLEHYRSRQDSRPVKGGDYLPLPDDEGGAVDFHDWGRVPVFHFRRNRRRTTGELAGRVRPQQDMVNKLLADMMVSSEFAGFRQRYAITNADLSDLEASPTDLWKLPPGSDDEGATQVGSFDTTELGNFMGSRTALAEGIAIISHTPKHYMTGAATPSGEALMAMDAPLTKKVDHYTELFGETWRELAVFYCHLKGIEVKGSDVTVLWANSGIDQPETTSNVVRNYTTAQMPLETTLREHAGWTPAQLERMHEDKETAAEKAPPTFGEIALKAAAQNLNGAANPRPVPGATEEPADEPPGNGKAKTPANPFAR